MKRSWWQRFKSSSAHTQANIVCTIVMAIATCAYAFIAGRQLILINRQVGIMQGALDETKRSGEQSTQQMWSAVGNINWMARSMDWSQKEAQRSIELSEQENSKTLNASVEAFHTTQRPYVTIENMRFDPSLAEKQSKSVMQWDFHNAGKTPALRVAYTHDVFIDGVKLGETPPDFPEETIIAADRSVGGQLTVIWAPGIEDDIIAGTKKLELKATIRYTDIFKQWHTTTFCAAYRATVSPTWVYCPGNDVN